MRRYVLCLIAFAVLPKISLVAEEALQPTAMVEAGLLQRSDVIVELVITDDQRIAMRRAVTTREFRERFQALRVQYPPPSKAFVREAYRDRATALKGVLTQNQVQRLDELRWQFQLLGDFGPTIREAVSLDAQQQKLIAEKEAELANELQKELQAFYRKSQRDLQELLTPEQNDKWKALVGSPFEFQSAWQRLTPLGALR